MDFDIYEDVFDTLDNYDSEWYEAVSDDGADGPDLNPPLDSFLPSPCLAGYD